jgi:hypothetical protein
MIVRQPPRLTNRKGVLKFLEVDLWTWDKEVSQAFTKINFADNFQAFTVTGLSIPAGKEVAIQNLMANKYPGIIPTGRIITRQTGDANIIDGVKQWTAELLYLRNPSANDAVVSVLFYI